MAGHFLHCYSCFCRSQDFMSSNEFLPLKDLNVRGKDYKKICVKLFRKAIREKRDAKPEELTIAMKK